MLFRSEVQAGVALNACGRSAGAGARGGRCFQRQVCSAEFHGAMERFASQVSALRMWTTMLGLLLAGAIIVIIVLLMQK